MIVGSRMPVILDEWEDPTDDLIGKARYRIVLEGGRELRLLRWYDSATRWSDADFLALPIALRRLHQRINVNNVEARRISFLAAALMRVLQLAEKLVADAFMDAALTTTTSALRSETARRHLAAVKGVLLACKMPLERWKVELDGVEEDPETAEARRRLGLDVKPPSS